MVDGFPFMAILQCGCILVYTSTVDHGTCMVVLKNSCSSALGTDYCSAPLRQSQKLKEKTCGVAVVTGTPTCLLPVPLDQTPAHPQSLGVRHPQEIQEQQKGSSIFVNAKSHSDQSFSIQHLACLTLVESPIFPAKHTRYILSGCQSSVVHSRFSPTESLIYTFWPIGMISFWLAATSNFSSVSWSRSSRWLWL